jgi:serine/threonine-protein kinase
MGTPWYMSPEQARREEPDRRSDIYSIGVIVYEALVGEAPYDHPELGALLEQVKAGGAPPLLSRRPELGAELSAVIEQAMATDPAVRFESAAQMAAHLEELAAKLPRSLMCAPPTTVTRTDTELVSRPAHGVLRTRELGTAGGMTQPVWTWRSRRGAAVVSAILGVALLIWMGSRPGTPPESMAAGAPDLQAASLLPGRPGAAPGGPLARSPREKGEPTLAATTGLPTSSAPVENEKRASRRARSADGKARAGRAALPEVFRTPGF